MHLGPQVSPRPTTLGLVLSLRRAVWGMLLLYMLQFLRSTLAFAYLDGHSHALAAGMRLLRIPASSGTNTLLADTGQCLARKCRNNAVLKS